MITSSTKAGLHSKVGNLDFFRRLHSKPTECNQKTTAFLKCFEFLQIALSVFCFFIGLFTALLGH
jgi:hypothetical protein